ncbi:MAG: hypothetical protein ACYS47_13880 [Planctomycetota bacterium]|jgi:hypothetical protein
MKPILVFFWKPEDLLGFGEKNKRDPEVAACNRMNKDLWKRWIITELAKEFECVRVNLREADPKLRRKHKVARAPVVAIYDFRLKPVYFTASPKVKFTAFAKVMNRARIKVEKAVKALAGSEEESELAKRARIRSKEIDQRDHYDAGLTFLQKRKWGEAETEFKKGCDIDLDGHWRDKCETGLAEIEAGKIFVHAEKLIKAKRYTEARNALQRILVEFKEAKYFGSLATEKMQKLAAKMK